MNPQPAPAPAAISACLQPLAIDVVSIQSQVVYGHVGNSVAVPTLRGHGLNVAAVPSVMLSNTPHYPTLHGGALPSDWFEGYLQDLCARGALERLRAILVGYLGNPEQAAILSRWIERIQALHPEVLVIVDPVIGDHDHGVYVASGMIQAYQRHLLPLAHGLTPNGFELEQLTGQPAGTVEQVIAAARGLLTAGLRWLTVTSAAPDSWPAGEMRLVIVSHDNARIVSHPRIAASPKGTGDLFSAELTGRLLRGTALSEAVTAASGTVVSALEHTRRLRCAELVLPSLPGAGSPC